MQKTFISDKCKYYIWNSIVNIGLSKEHVYDVLLKRGYDKYLVMNELSYDPDDNDFIEDDDAVMMADDDTVPSSESTTVIETPPITSAPVGATPGPITVKFSQVNKTLSPVQLSNRYEKSLPITLSDLENIPNSKNIELYRYKDVLTDQQIDYMIDTIKKNALESTVMKSTGNEVNKETRSSKTHYFYRDPVADEILQKITNDLGLVADNIEGIQGTSYDTGCLYKGHHDYIYDQGNINKRGQRNWTILIYLNDDYTGGETIFVEADQVIKPVRNNAIVWNNLKNNAIDVDTLHEAKAVQSGTKYVLQIWVRNKAQS